MTTNIEVTHLWANGQSGATTNLSSYHGSLISYDTVIAQWLDNDTVVMLDTALTNTTGKHIYYAQQALSGAVHLIRCHVEPGLYSYYRNVDFKGSAHWELSLARTLCNNALEALSDVHRSALTHAKARVLDYIRKKLSFVYGEKKWFTKKGYASLYGKPELKKLEALLGEGELKDIVDILCGKGSWEAQERILVSYQKRTKTEAFKEWCSAHGVNWLSSKDIQRIFKNKRLGSFFLNTWINSGIKHCYYESHNSGKKYRENACESEKRLIKYYTGNGYTQWRYLNRVKNAFNGEVYDLRNQGVYSNAEMTAQLVCNVETIYFNVVGFKAASDKKLFMNEFYRRCRHQQRCCQRYNMWRSHNLAVTEHENSMPFNQKIYDAINLLIERKKADEKVKAEMVQVEKLRIQQEKAAKLEGLRQMGVEGARTIWRSKFEALAIAQGGYSDGDFYDGGNVLLRWLNDKCIETSKGIKISIEKAKTLSKLVQKWHENPSSFKESDLTTDSGIYSAVSFENDRLTAGCHTIAYSEMKRMMEEINAK